MMAKNMSMLLLGVSMAAAVSHAQSNADLWDVSQGTVVTADSGAIPGYSIDSMFGGASPFSDWAYFSDSQPPGFTHFVEWETPGPVTVGLVRMHAFGDDFLNNGREFDQFTLRAKSPGSPVYDVVVLTYNATHPYTFINPINALVIDQTVAAVTSSSFRAEFVQYTAGFGFDGPRIVELDAFPPPPPQISSQPASLTLNIGMPAIFSVTATGSGTLQYQWHKDGTPLAGQTLDTLRINSVTVNDMGSYSVAITDSIGTAFSDPAILNVDLLNVLQASTDLFDVSTGNSVTSHSGLHPVAGSIQGMFGGVTAAPESYWTYFADNQPTNTVHFVEFATPSPVTVRTIRLFAHGDPGLNNGREFSNFTLKAKGPGSSSYNIVIGTFTPTHPYAYLDTSLVLDAEFAPVLASAFRAEFTQYTAGYGFDGPRIVELDAFDTRPLVRPTVLVNPESKTVPKNTPVTFQVRARGGNLSYQWKFMGQNISNETTDTLKLKHAKQNQQGYYTVVVSNAAGSVESAQALLLVTH